MSYKINKLITTAQNFYLSTKGNLLSNKIDAYWWSDIKNFGDLLTPFLLKKYNLTPIKKDENSSHLFSTGSILQRAPESFSGTILGSGLIEPSKRRFPNAKVLSVRGPLTRDFIGADKDVSLGDPGLLVSRFVEKPDPSFQVGVVPHYKDKEHPKIKEIIKFFGKDALLIDVCRKPKDVINDIAKCSVIISSSLHGLIVGHSFCLPCVWLRLGNIPGTDFKYQDYFASVGFSQAPFFSSDIKSITDLKNSATAPQPDIIREKILETHFLFEAFSRSVLNSTNRP
ncbi:polysaccharide pyruvyl transferase family protein [Marinobacter sp.]|uniref:polysaccharide pyruvyl transferase family protein n=1 Tax=Marinobacter sp. TaxID=50741 RepID=UPI00384BB214